MQNKVTVAILLLFVFLGTYLSAEEAENWIPDPNLRRVIREEISLSEATPLEKRHLALLHRFNAYNKGIRDISGLAFATNLIELHLSNNPIADLAPLAGLTQLQEIHFWHSPPRTTHPDLQPLANLTNLKLLSLSGNNITDISEFAGLSQLEFLHIEGNNITDVSALAGFTNLQVLDIRFNGRINITPLLHLKIRDFHYDWICEISPVDPPVIERIQNRTFPSIALPGGSLVINENPVRWLKGSEFYEEAAKHDLNHYGTKFGLVWHLTAEEPNYGLSTRLWADPELGGDVEHVMSEYEQYHLHLGRRHPMSMAMALLMS